MLNLQGVIENIKGIKNVEISMFADEIVCAFQDYEYEGKSEVIVSNNQAYINHSDAPIIRFESQENEDGTISIIDAWIV